MRVWLFFLFLVAFSFSSYCQVPDSLTEYTGDTLETIVSDTTIIYIIQQAPVTIHEKFELVMAREKKRFQLSAFFSVLSYQEKRKASAGNEAYLEELNAVSSGYYAYSIGTSLWQCPKKIYSGLGINFLIVKQNFGFSDVTNASYKSLNSFNYFTLNGQLGYCINKDKKISFIPYGALQGEYLLSYSGFTYDQSLARVILVNTIRYQKYLLGFSAQLKCVLDLKSNRIEIEPFVSYLVTPVTMKNELYSARRSFIGIRVGIINKLF